MLRTLALSASVITFAGGLALAEAPMTREPSTGRSVATSSLSTDHWFMILPKTRSARSPIL
jgi:hypothetical protein